VRVVRAQDPLEGGQVLLVQRDCLGGPARRPVGGALPSGGPRQLGAEASPLHPARIKITTTPVSWFSACA
jgi:hypothetical protein